MPFMNPELHYRQPDMMGAPGMQMPGGGMQNNFMTGQVPGMQGNQFGPGIQQRIAQMMQPQPNQPAPMQPQPGQPAPVQQPSPLGPISGSPGTEDPGGLGGFGGGTIDGSPGTQDAGGIMPNNMFGGQFQFQNQAQRDAFNRFMTSPDYQFRMNEGVRAMDSSAAQRGLLLSGNQLRSLQEFGQGMASGEYGNYYNRMAGIAGLSQPTDFGGFAGMGANTMAQMMGSRGQLTANIGNIQGAGANAQGAIMGNMFGNIPWQQIGNAMSGVFGGGKTAGGVTATGQKVY
jgi:hypothetical protein